MTGTGPAGPHRSRMGRVVFAVALVGVCAIVAVWFLSGSPRADDDCPVVEDVARQWNSNSERVAQVLLNGTGHPDEYRKIAGWQEEMAETLGRAVDTAESEDIKSQLTAWASGAREYAQLQRSVADGGRSGQEIDAQFIALAASMNEAATSLSQRCPGMPAAGQ